MLIHFNIPQMKRWRPKFEHSVVDRSMTKINVNLLLRCKNVSKMFSKQHRSLKHHLIQSSAVGRDFFFQMKSVDLINVHQSLIE